MRHSFACVFVLIVTAAPARGGAAGDAVRTIADPESSREMREQATVTLQQMGATVGEEDVARLAELVRNKQVPWEVRFSAARAIGVIVPAGRSATPALIEVAKDPADRICGMAVLTMGRLKVNDPAAVEVVVPLLEAGQKDKDLPPIAAFALYHMGPAAAPATKALMRAADASDASLRINAMRALSAIGPAAAEAMPLAMERIKSSESIDRVGAVEMLGGIGAALPDAHRAMVAALADSSIEVRKAAARALGEIGPPVANAAASALENAMKEPELKLEAAAALYRVNGSAAAFDALKEMALSDQAKLEVFERLKEIGEPAAVIFAEVITRDGRGARWSIDSLGAMGPRGKQGVPALVGVLKAGRSGKNRHRFDAAITSLQKIGPAAAEAVPVLEQITEPPDVRARAEAALRAIRSP